MFFLQYFIHRDRLSVTACIHRMAVMSESEATTSASTAGVEVPNSSGELLPQLYAELRKLAAHRLARERPGQTLQATALVHEAWLRLENSPNQKWNGRAHFFAAAAEAMRRILVDNARRKQRLKHGGGGERVEIEAVELAAPLPDEQLLELDEALNQLAGLDPPAAQLVKLRFFAGLTQAEAAEQLGLSRSTADRTWQFARAWLFDRIRPPDPPGK
jgi:RNA polymerase sigma factor (TIGR02999 family)